MPEREETTAKSRRRFILIVLLVAIVMLLIDIAWIQGPIQQKTDDKAEQVLDRERLARDLGLEYRPETEQDADAETGQEAGSARRSRDEQVPLNPGLAAEPDEQPAGEEAEAAEAPAEEPVE